MTACLNCSQAFSSYLMKIRVQSHHYKLVRYESEFQPLHCRSSAVVVVVMSVYSLLSFAIFDISDKLVAYEIIDTFSR